MRGGLKRKRPIAKIEEIDSRRVTFSKRIKGLRRKAAELCLHDPESQIAIITTPHSSSNSNASFYSFGHSSVDNVVAAFLADQRPPPPPPPEDHHLQGLGFWWEDKALTKSEDPEELRNAIVAANNMLLDLRMAAVDNRGDMRMAVKEKKKKKKKKTKKNILHCPAHQIETLNLLLPSSSSASRFNQDKNFDKNTVKEQVLAICEENLDGFGDELEALLMNVDHQMDETTNQNPFSDSSEGVKGGGGGELVVVHRDDFYENLPDLVDLHQFLAISDNDDKNPVVLPGNYLGEFKQELDLDEMNDLDSLLMNLEKMRGW